MAKGGRGGAGGLGQSAHLSCVGFYWLLSWHHAGKAPHQASVLPCQPHTAVRTTPSKHSHQAGSHHKAEAKANIIQKPFQVLPPTHSPINTMHGAAPAASWNSCLILASLSPLMPLTTSGADTRRKGTPHSLAMALASAVLPQPGGPCSRTPRGGSTPNQPYTWQGRGGEGRRQQQPAEV